MAKQIKLDEAIKEALDEYESKIDLTIKAGTEAIAKAGAKEIRDNAKATFNGKKYYKSWTYQVTTKRLATEGVIYSRMPGLPHLLENGHLTRNGKRVPGKKHIAPVEEKITKEYVETITRGIEQ